MRSARQRQAAGVFFSLDSVPGKTFAAEHLLTTLGELWPPLAPDLWLSTPSPALLADLLDLGPQAIGKVVVPSVLLNDPAIAQRVLRAQQRGLQLVWHGEPGQQQLPAFAMCFAQIITSLRYRSLKKNTAQLFTLFALSNLWMVHGKLIGVQA